MPFETVAFAAFLTIALGAFWLSGSTTVRNLVLIAASYVFCGWLDARFAAVLGFVSATSFAGAFWIDRSRSDSARRARLVTCVAALASTLLILKYGRLFTGALAAFAPIGLSYYVLQTSGYCIDVFRGRPPERRVTTYFAYVGFFPYLVSGPIARASTVLPQFASPRRLSLDAATRGARQIVWGLFKKVVVADALALTVDYVFARHGELSGSVLAVGLAMYSFQVYADFSGYSDIAIGLGRLFGFDLPQNFDSPYFSRSVREFWRRWHMSLSAWLREYVYQPLGGHGSSRSVYARNILLVFGLSGLWHGFTWNFLVWGLVNGAFFLPGILLGRRRRPEGSPARDVGRRAISDVAGVCATFGLVSLSRVFFRAPDMSSALGYLRALCDWTFFTLPDLNVAPLGWVAVMLVVEWTDRHGLPFTVRRPVLQWARYVAYAAILYVVGAGLATSESRQFIYARF